MENRRKKRFGPLGVVVYLLLLALAAALIYAVAVNRDDLTPRNILATLTPFRASAYAGAYTYEDSEAFADLNGGLVAVSRGRITVFDRYAEAAAEELVSLTQPVAASDGAHAVIYDAGGTLVRVYQDGMRKLALDMDGSVISASVNGRGWLALSLTEPGYRGTVRVYNAEGKPVYQWYSLEGYVVSAQVSPDCKSLAVLTAGKGGGTIVFLKLDSETEVSRLLLDGEVVLDIKYKDNAGVVAVGRSGVWAAAAGGETAFFDFDGRKLIDYAFGSDGHVVAALTETAAVTGETQVVSILDGKSLGEKGYDSRVLDLAARGGRVAVLTQGGLSICKKSMDESAFYPDPVSGTSVIMRSDQTALVIGAYRAAAYSAK